MKKLCLLLCLTLLIGAVVPLSVTAGGEKRFDDVTDDSWYAEAVYWCNEKEFMTGTSETTFSPKDTMTRAMFVMVMAKVAGADLSVYENAEMSFSDVKAGSWYAAAAEWAYANSLASGIGTDEATGKPIFGSKRELTRQQTAVFMKRFAEYMGCVCGQRPDLRAFPDA